MKRSYLRAFIVLPALCAITIAAAACPGATVTTRPTSTVTATFTTHVPGGTPTPVTTTVTVTPTTSLTLTFTTTTTATPTVTLTTATTATTTAPTTTTMTPTTTTAPTTTTPTTTTTQPTTTATATGQTAGQLSGQGQGVYNASCALCHGPGGQGGTGPRLIGAGHGLTKYATARGLFDYIRANMPFSSPGSLSQPAYLQVTAYLLLQNNYVNANTPFAENNLAAIPLN